MATGEKDGRSWKERVMENVDHVFESLLPVRDLRTMPSVLKYGLGLPTLGLMMAVFIYFTYTSENIFTSKHHTKFDIQ